MEFIALIIWRENNVCGFIKVDRKILEWEWYKDEHTKNFFFHCLLKANWKEGRFKGITIERGQFVASLPVLSNELSLTVNEVRTAIKHLKITGEITVKAYPKFSVFTVVNYDLYQCESQAESQTNHRQITDKSQADNRQITGKSQPINRLLTTIEEEKEYKEDKKERKEEGKNINTPPISPSNEGELDKPKTQKKEPVIYYPNDELLDSAFKEFLTMRNKIKKPIATKQALTRMLNKVEKLSGGDNDLAIKILNQSTDNCWQDVYELKDKNPRKSSNVFDEWRNA